MSIGTGEGSDTSLPAGFGQSLSDKEKQKISDLVDEADAEILTPEQEAYITEQADIGRTAAKDIVLTRYNQGH